MGPPPETRELGGACSAEPGTPQQRRPARIHTAPPGKNPYSAARQESTRGRPGPASKNPYWTAGAAQRPPPETRELGGACSAEPGTPQQRRPARIHTAPPSKNPYSAAQQESIQRR